ncbi:MAG: dTDP-4-dehydrorhamnose 3,5-epimerase [Phycisphaerales bacterium]|nr:MAG: dTDP-4-dehydrorhamnose 3,5-epimerase [Phycisphaerales bacterium]
MQFIPAQLDGVYIIELEPVTDERGFFARTFCEIEFSEHNLTSHFVQCSLAWNTSKGILRGLHYQVAPYEEVKVIRCNRGAIYDVVIDVRPDSATYGKWVATELSPGSNKMLYVPHGCAHGYQTLEPDSEVYYLISSPYAPSAQRGVRWNDPAFGVHWPITDPILSSRDRSHPDFEL